MKKFITLVEDMNIELDVVDLGFFKAALIIVGIMIGSTFPEGFRKIRSLLLISWICIFTFLMLKLFILPLAEEREEY
ncbi:MAG: hypothetical protein BEN19_06290 [Epulopiscium sp. Nuni2H_MBin003]|nr:MAG: hypothetical protein BEN19_06290 [Epulopiscium sp. Nuni2H_MBin003]